jgi:hypothetical protein
MRVLLNDTVDPNKSKDFDVIATSSLTMAEPTRTCDSNQSSAFFDNIMTWKLQIFSKDDCVKFFYDQSATSGSQTARELDPAEKLKKPAQREKSIQL